MRKKLLGIFLMAAMIVCAIPMSAAALGTAVELGGKVCEASGEYNKDTTVKDGNFSKIIRAGSVYVQYYDANGEKLSNNEGAASAVITLNNAEITGINFDAIAIDGIDAKIVVVGDSNSVATLADATNECYGIYSNGYLTIGGTGTVGVYNTNYHGVYSANTITLAESPKLEVESGKTAIWAGVEVNFNLAAGGKVYAKSTSTEEYYGAVKVESADTITLAANNYITTPVNGEIYKAKYSEYIVAKGENKPAKEAVVEYKAGANTADSSDFVFYGIIALLAIAGAGLTLKREEN